MRGLKCEIWFIEQDLIATLLCQKPDHRHCIKTPSCARWLASKLYPCLESNKLSPPSCVFLIEYRSLLLCTSVPSTILTNSPQVLPLASRLQSFSAHSISSISVPWSCLKRFRAVESSEYVSRAVLIFACVCVTRASWKAWTRSWW